MNPPESVNIFIPTYIFHRKHRRGLLFGHLRSVPNQATVNINLTALLPYDSSTIEQLAACTDFAHQTSSSSSDDDDGSRWDPRKVAQQAGKLQLCHLGELADNCPQTPTLAQQRAYATVRRQLAPAYGGEHSLVLTFDDPMPAASTDLLSGSQPNHYQSLQLTSLLSTVDGRQLCHEAHISLIFYDTRNFMSSQMLSRFNIDDNRVEFVEFINDSLRSTAQMVTGKKLLEAPATKSSHSAGSNLVSPGHSSSHSSSLLFLHLLFFMPRRLIRAFVYFTSPQSSLSWSTSGTSDTALTTPFDALLSPLAACFNFSYLEKSSTAAQLKFRFLQLAICWKLLWEIPLRRISLSLGNVLSSVVLDTALGILALVALHVYSSPGYWLESAWAYADSMVDNVDQLLKLLQSMPAGLKLNRPLNQALSQFYLYHIYLWKSYMDIIRPIFGPVMQASLYCGFFGFSCILSLLSDIFTLVTIHIYCFYGYGCQLYGLQISGISALWRLFRGKKYNQLRNRVDSYSYNNEQLFIGTILFTVLLFLLPTVFMYYLVFLVLRFLTLAVQEGLFFFIEHISSMPLYSLALWLFNSRTISGEVYFEVLNLREREERDEEEVREAVPGSNHHPLQPQARPTSPLLVRLRTKRVSLLAIVSSRYDALLSSLAAYRLSSQTKQLTWNEFFDSCLTGKLLHQNLSIGISLLLFIGYILLLVYFTIHTVAS